jgi:hypothetical protein
MPSVMTFFLAGMVGLGFMMMDSTGSWKDVDFSLDIGLKASISFIYYALMRILEFELDTLR